MAGQRCERIGRDNRHQAHGDHEDQIMGEGPERGEPGLLADHESEGEDADGGDGQKALQQLFEKARPILNKGTLVEQVCAVLSPAHARELRRVHAEYTAAGMQDRLDRGEQKDRFGARLAEGFAHFQKEIENSGQRVFEGGDREFKELVMKLDLTPQQDSDGFGCDYHPSLATHQKMATQVTAVLRSTLGW